MRRVLCMAVALGMLAAVAAYAAPVTLYVAPDGNDAWSGRAPKANAAKTDGPLASVIAARDAIRKLREKGEATDAVNVVIGQGTYRMAEPLVLGPADSGTEAAPVTYAAAEGARPVLSGGRVLTGWQKGDGAFWTLQIPEVAAGEWYFQQLFVNGQRRQRARTPNSGYFNIVRKGPPLVDPITKTESSRNQTAFIYNGDDIKQWPGLNDINVVFYHSWETARLRIASVEEANHIVNFTGPSWWEFEYFGPNRRYYVENAPDALDAPGEWYLDRKTGVLSYFPMPGENMRRAEVVAPALPRLVELRGEPMVGQYVEHVNFQGLTFAHQDWALEPKGRSDPQAVFSAPAAIMADGAHDCAFTGCEIVHVGDNGIWLRRGCRRVAVSMARIHDMGVGGIRIGEPNDPGDDNAESSYNTLDNNHIYDGGHVYAAGVGIFVSQSSHNRITHNEIRDLDYSGMSLGWSWGDEPNRCHDNLIEYNHVHHVMRGQLSDGGAIYTLGASAGTVIRNNVVHDVWPFDSPPYGWGIYLDATGSGYTVENNIVYNVRSGGQMYTNGGHEHLIRNNIFAFANDYAVWPYWEHRPSAFNHNIMYMDRGKTLFEPSEFSLKERIQKGEPLGDWNSNCWWFTDRKEPRFFGHSFADWQKLGLDRDSIVADPQFVDAKSHNFALKPTSPALALGFKPIDTSQVGLYGPAAWVNEAKNLKYPPTVFPEPPPPPKPTQVSDGFEADAVGQTPTGATVSGQKQGASIRITDEQAAPGEDGKASRHSLKFTDVTGLEPAFEPHMFYQPHFTEGIVRQSFDVRLEPKTFMFTEWRDNTAYPDCIGPSVRFDGQGTVRVGDRVLTIVPLGQWVHVDIVVSLAKDAPRTFSVTVKAPGLEAQDFRDLPLRGNDFHELHWLGFVSDATVDSTFYLDNLHITNTTK